MGYLTPRDFAWALRKLKAGDRVKRAGWSTIQLQIFKTSDDQPMIGQEDEAGNIFPWLPNSLDLLATDWRTAGEQHLADPEEPLMIGHCDIDVDGPPEF